MENQCFGGFKTIKKTYPCCILQKNPWILRHGDALPHLRGHLKPRAGASNPSWRFELLPHELWQLPL